MQCLGYTSINTVFGAYQKLKFNHMSCISSGNPQETPWIPS